MKRRRFSARDLTARLEHFGRKCQMCFQEITGATGLEWDHHIPLAIGGDDELDNLEPLCIRCHRVKTKGDVTKIAKSTRQRQRNLGIKKSKAPMPFGRGDPRKRKMDGTIVDRRTGEPWKG